MTDTIHYRRNRLISHPKLRRQLFQREHGVCQLCGRDCEALRKRLRALSPEARRLERLRLGIPEGRTSYWDIHHRLAVAEGGTNLMENLQTICVWCHPQETQALIADLAARRRTPPVLASELAEVFGD